MFERFTDRARRVVVVAQEEAGLLGHDHIGTEHILLGLIHEDEGIAAKVLESLGISLEAIRSQVEEIIGQGGSSPSAYIPFSPRAKKVLELSQREALQLGHTYIGTEHILLGLIREGEGVAAQVLVTSGADLSRVRQQVIQQLSGYAGSGGQRSVAASVVRAPVPREELFFDVVRFGEDMRVLTLEALVASWDGDLERLREHLGQLTILAHLAGDSAQLARLGHIIEIDDAATGRVRLRPKR